jgi:hypothetical protein
MALPYEALCMGVPFLNPIDQVGRNLLRALLVADNEGTFSGTKIMPRIALDGSLKIRAENISIRHTSIIPSTTTKPGSKQPSRER